MRKKRLEFAVRARRDIETIEAWYLESAGEAVADRAVDAIQDGLARNAPPSAASPN